MRAFHKMIAIQSVVMMMFVVMIVYWQDLSILVNEAFQSEAVSHVILVPFLVSYLIYRKRELVKASLAFERLQGKTKLISLGDIVGAAFCLSAFVLYWLGSYTFYPLEYHVVSLLVFVVGITLILFNFKTLKALIFPILFLVFLVPPPSDVTYAAGSLMANFNSQASYTLLRIVGLPVTLSSEYGPPTIVLNDLAAQSFRFAVDLPCSGIYSLVAFIMFAAFLAFIIHGSLIKKAVLLILGFLILQILNIIRISLTVSVAHWLGEETAMTIFHVFTGWLLIFFGMLSLLLIAEKLLHLQIFGGSNEASPCSECDNGLKNQEFFCSNCGKFLKNVPPLGVSKRFWVKIPALLLASCLFTFSTQAPVFAFAQGLTVTSSSPQVNTEAFPRIEGYELKFLYRDVNFEKISRQDASLVYAYSPLNASTPVYVLVGVAGSISNLHSWEVCWVALQTAHGRPPLVSVLDSRDVQIMQNPPIIARYFVFQRPDKYIQVTLYWYERALFNTGLTVEPRYVRLSLIALTENPADYPRLEEELLPFANSIAEYWEPVKSKALISLGVPILQSMLVIAICFVVIAKVARYTRDQRKRSDNLKIFERFASPNEKLVFQTIRSLSEENKALTTQAVASALEKNTGKRMQSNELMNVLSRLEEHGLIRRDIANVKDEPVLIWKP
jgi:exosortase